MPQAIAACAGKSDRIVNMLMIKVSARKSGMSLFRLLGAPHRAVPVLVAVMVAVPLLGCGEGAVESEAPVATSAASDTDEGPAAASTTSEPFTRFTVERSTWGGMCAEGPCRSELVVEGDGRWRYEEHDGEDEGQLTVDELDRLLEAVTRTRLSQTRSPSTRCAADSDGTSVAYSWTIEDEKHRVDSCEVSIDTEDPLVQELESLAHRITG
ncbi:hypothetical protein [Ornithinimicrobium avium]|uniref:Uncharacterized protein n=1 Tax=Ornithinimicrobium avium TaxID=2283195 RepID=A0A345NQR8_9MICO|nr:hypothetical protein [Ornithinimicrobium avium]AXH97376.1 hypothetical protein DV701_15775 [Ornithinimicrobium avium]